MATSKQNLTDEKKEIKQTAVSEKTKNDVPAISKPEDKKVIEITPAEKVPAEKKTVTKKAPAKKAPAKTADKAPEKKAEKKPAVKKETTKKATTKSTKTTKTADKGPVKTGVTYEDVVKLTAKKVLASDLGRLAEFISCEIVIYGDCDGKFYIEIDGDKISVEPWDYKNSDVQIFADSATLVKIVTGKMSIYDAIVNEKVNVYGNTNKAILLINASF